ncbi:MAG: hypothetical protein R3B13_18345 [Polyangiaceae bacterium]
MNAKNILLFSVIAAAIAAGCSDGESDASCADFCGPGATCVDGSCVPLACDPACQPGMACENGSCVPIGDVSCDPACGPCQSCDSTGTTPQCKDLCGTGSQCDTTANQCLPIACDPACGPGTACENGTCKPVEAISCKPACGACETCDTAGATPECKKVCGSGTTCDAALNACITTEKFHAQAPELAGPFATGYEVTKACVGCHQDSAKDFMATIHWKWAGPTPQMVDAKDLTTTVNPGDIGKTKLINNFCVGVVSNEKRCDQCHAGYGGDPDTNKPQKSARYYMKFDMTDTTADSSIPLEQRVDCLVCHANPKTGYAKDPKTFGNPLASLDLSKTARDLVKPTRENCGSCHFYAGGGDNVKLMGSSLKNPSPSVDVHMGNGMSCSSCHAAPGHKFKGAGVHTPANDGRASCSDCHGATPHKNLSNGSQLDTHAQRIACQTCHIPAFSRTQFAKVNWDWATAGDNTQGVNGVVSTKVNDMGVADPNGTAVTTYDFMKGSFVWKRNVKPAYAWYDGRMMHLTTDDKSDFTTLGLDPNDESKRIVIGRPIGVQSDTKAKIHPFKLMLGRQAVYIDGAQSFIANPNVFGPGSLWGIITAAGWTYSPSAMQNTWSTTLSKGAQAAGQVASGTSLAPFDGTKGWDFRYTKLYMDLNHEVAPKAQALGASGACADCHSATPKIPMCELYATATTKPWGLSCP